MSSKRSCWGEVVQTSIFAVLAIAAIISYCQFREIKQYNQRYLRPWVSISLSTLRILGDSLKLELKLKNHGLSPAMNVKFYCEAILNRDTYVSDSLRLYSLREKDREPKAILFPNDSMNVPITRLIPLSELTVLDYNTAVIENRLFLHCYVDFLDVTENHMGYQLLAQVKLRRVESGVYDPDLYPIYTKYKPLY